MVNNVGLLLLIICGLELVGINGDLIVVNSDGFASGFHRL